MYLFLSTNLTMLASLARSFIALNSDALVYLKRPEVALSAGVIAAIAADATVKTTLEVMINSDNFPQFAVNWNILYPENRDIDVKSKVVDALVHYKECRQRYFSVSALLMALNNLLPEATPVTFPAKLVLSHIGLSKADNTCFPDVRLLADDNTQGIPCHRWNLASQSDFFKLLFTTSLAEANKSEIRICEIDHSLLEKIISCCYVREVEISSTSELYDLLLASDKFQMPFLRKACLGLLKQIFWTEKTPDLTNPVAFNFTEEFKAKTEYKEGVVSLLEKLNFDDAEGKSDLLEWLIRNWRVFEGSRKKIPRPYLKHFKVYLGDNGNS